MRKEEPNKPDTTGMADPMAAGIDQAIAGCVDVGVWIGKAAQDHNVRHTEAPIDVFATAAFPMQGLPLMKSNSRSRARSQWYRDRLPTLRAARGVPPPEELMPFDPSGDYAARGHLRNIAGESDPERIRHLERHAFAANVRTARHPACRIDCNDLLETNRILLSSIDLLGRRPTPTPSCRLFSAWLAPCSITCRAAGRNAGAPSVWPRCARPRYSGDAKLRQSCLVRRERLLSGSRGHDAIPEAERERA